MYENIKEKIRQIMSQRDSRLVDGSYWDFKRLLDYVESLDKESEDLEQAAKEYSADKNYPVHAYSGFKAGANWMSEQYPHWEKLPCPADWVYDECNIKRPSLDLGMLAEYDIICAGYKLDMAKLATLPKRD